MHCRTLPRLLLLPFFLVAGCTDEAGCPAGAERVDGVCVSRDAEDAGTDGRAPEGDGDTDSATPAPCYLDHDRDGVGAGDQVDCDYVPAVPELDASADSEPPTADGGTSDAAVSTDAGAGAPEPVDPPQLPPAVVTETGDCDDFDAARAPTLDEVCDGVDNDCDDDVDEDIRNACGGECVRPLEHQPGETCSNGLLGACAREGTYRCQGDSAVTCSAPVVAPSGELCDDNLDNDCDGLVDEPDATNAPSWYQDCDADGYATSTTGAVQSCSKPANVGACSWTSTIPQPATRTNWDCNDASAAYSPAVTTYGVAPAGSLSYDLNCDGVSEKAPNQAAGAPTPCTATLVQHFDDGFPLDDCPAAGSVNGCVIWRSGDTYARAPQAFCPDSGGFRVNIEPYRDQNGNQAYRCTTAASGAVQWPCR